MLCAGCKFPIFGLMRKMEKIRNGFRLCIMLVLYLLFLVTQLVSVNAASQHASIYIFSSKFTQICANAGEGKTILSGVEDDSGPRINKRFYYQTIITITPIEWSSLPLMGKRSFGTTGVTIFFFEVIPDRLLRGPPIA